MSKVIIITVVDEFDKAYLFRTMQNVDEQTSRDWYHCILVSSEYHEEIASLAKMRSPYYQKNMIMCEEPVGIHEYDFLALHNIYDKWSPFFLEKMIFELEQDEKSSAIVSQRNDVSERMNGNLIVVDNMFESPHLPVGVLPMELAILKDIKFIQTVFRTKYFDPALSHPLYCIAEAIAEEDILSASDYLAFHHIMVDQVETDTSEQRAVNWAIRSFPYMR